MTHRMTASPTNSTANTTMAAYCQPTGPMTNATKLNTMIGFRITMRHTLRQGVK